jgi:DNA-binding MarR family transcriptional regulator
MKREESIGRWVSVLYRQIRINIDKELITYNIGSTQIQVLRVIINNDGINQENISRLLHVDKATVTRSVNKLVKEGYVIRNIDANDKRAYVLHLTQKGKDLEPTLRKILKSITVKLLTDFSNEEKEIAFSIFKKMHQNMIVNNSNLIEQ